MNRHGGGADPLAGQRLAGLRSRESLPLRLAPAGWPQQGVAEQACARRLAPTARRGRARRPHRPAAAPAESSPKARTKEPGHPRSHRCPPVVPIPRSRESGEGKLPAPSSLGTAPHLRNHQGRPWSRSPTRSARVWLAFSRPTSRLYLHRQPQQPTRTKCCRNANRSGMPPSCRRRSSKPTSKSSSVACDETRATTTCRGGDM